MYGLRHGERRHRDRPGRRHGEYLSRATVTGDEDGGLLYRGGGLTLLLRADGV